MWSPQPSRRRVRDRDAELYGLGGSSIDEWAEKLLGRIEGDLAVVGASIGGYVALAMARRAPERVKGLMLVGSRAADDPPERKAARRMRFAPRRRRPEAWAPNAPAPPAERTVDEVKRAIVALRDRRDHSDVVRSFDGPLWVVVGDGDPFTPLDEAREIAEQAKSGRLRGLRRRGPLPEHRSAGALQRAPAGIPRRGR